MLELFLIRHAKSSWDNPLLTDFERTLNTRGLRDAPFMAKVFQKEVPNAATSNIISSTANRAMQTAEEFRNTLNINLEITKEPKLYHANVGVSLAVLNQVSEEHKSVMIFGHNPGISHFVDYLSGSSIGNMPTASIVGLRFELENWKMASSNTANMFYYTFPKKHQ